MFRGDRPPILPGLRNNHIQQLIYAFECGVNDLPLTMNISWFEQKAIVVLLTLLHLGIKNIRRGPALPAFISPNVLDVLLVEKFGIRGIGDNAEGTCRRTCVEWPPQRRLSHPTFNAQIKTRPHSRVRPRPCS